MSEEVEFQLEIAKEQMHEAIITLKDFVKDTSR